MHTGFQEDDLLGKNYLPDNLSKQYYKGILLAGKVMPCAKNSEENLMFQKGI